MRNKTPSCEALTSLLTTTIIILYANQNFRLVQADLIDETCSKIFFLSSECEMLLRSDPCGTKATDVKGLARVMIHKTIANATDTIQLFEKLEREATDPELKAQLSLCLCSYIGAVEDYFQNSLKNLEMNSFLEAAQNAHHGSKNAQKFASWGFNKSSTMWKKSKDLENLGIVSEGIVALLT